MSAVDMFWAAPPVSRTLTAAAVALSVPVWMGFISPYYVYWINENVLTLRAVPEVWRLVTPFILTGPKLGMIFDPYFLYTYGSALETGAPRFSGPGDFLVYIFFLCVVILVTCGYFLQGYVFLSALTLGLAYTFAQENPNRQMTYFIVTFSAKYLPYAMLLLTFIMASPQEALLQATGLLAAHLYDFLTRVWPEYGGGVRVVNTPLLVRKWFEEAGGTPQQRSYGTAFTGRTTTPQTPQQNRAGGGGGWASGFSSGSGSGPWNARGAGRRLGEE